MESSLALNSDINDVIILHALRSGAVCLQNVRLVAANHDPMIPIICDAMYRMHSPKLLSLRDHHNPELSYHFRPDLNFSDLVSGDHTVSTFVY